MGGTRTSNKSSSGMGHGGAVVGGYGILASLDRETAGTPCRAPGLPERAGTRGAIAAGLGVAALLAWWCFSGPSPVVDYQPKPMWTVAVSGPAPTPVAAIESPAAAGTVTPAAIVNEVSPLVTALNQPSPPAIAVRREVHLAHAAPKPLRRGTVHVPARAPQQLPAPADHDVSLLTALVAYTQGVATPAQDVVELRLADSTEALLQRCGRVGGEEGRLCRARICSGRVADSVCQTDQ
ncbi:hypothetical protein ACFFTM_10555 [Pseudoduganella plicata]|uniref:Uncharacterized protein n=1 Tax=Pseudoduganella plicata TaxID=321984 RepID=A0A4P7BD39_9BURK|nr:hypothetical protein [Pseudoduganella plicata]QBQ36110.1 hypothetical protein E1742_08045 [Pseudoduganella plicata]GGY78020.1 hypothetical protein GCM10007388_08560 [Pseudoduganella plicata]